MRFSRLSRRLAFSLRLVSDARAPPPPPRGEPSGDRCCAPVARVRTAAGAPLPLCLAAPTGVSMINVRLSVWNLAVLLLSEHAAHLMAFFRARGDASNGVRNIIFP